MLTWPCVSIEWNTPPIQTVDVSALSSGTRCRPVRSSWPCGRSTASSFARKDDVAVVAVEEGEQAALRVALDMASRVAETRVEVRILEVEGRQRRCRREEVRDRLPGR